MYILSEIKQRVTESMGLLVINKRMRKCWQTKVGTETWVDGGIQRRCLSERPTESTRFLPFGASGAFLH